jgi:hypothetical protein
MMRTNIIFSCIYTVNLLALTISNNSLAEKRPLPPQKIHEKSGASLLVSQTESTSDLQESGSAQKNDGSAPATGSSPNNPFADLKLVIPKEQLPPINSIRLRDSREAQDRSRQGTISIRINSIPQAATVSYGGKLLGQTPFVLRAQRGSTPYDVVIRTPGYMTLRTRIRRKIDRNYTFKLTPSKIR